MRRRRATSDNTLMPHEWQILKLMREGLTTSRSRSRWASRSVTAEYHVAEVLSKLGVGSRQKAVEVAKLRRGLQAAVPFIG